MLKPNINQPFRPVCCSSSRVFCHRCTSLSHPLAPTPLDPRSTLFTASHPAANPPPTPHPLPPSLFPLASPSVYDLRPKPFIVYGFASHILCYTSRPPFDLPRSPLLFALTEHKLVPRANADSGQFLWRHAVHAHSVTSARYLDGIPLRLRDPLSAQFSPL